MSTVRRLLLLAALLPGFGLYLAVSCSVPTQAREEATGSAGPSLERMERLREGSVVDLVGTFSATGDRIMFYTATEKRRFGTLENLNLERIGRMISDTEEPMQWSVSGAVTEFQGANYLLISRAVLKSKPQRRGVVTPSTAGKQSSGSVATP